MKAKRILMKNKRIALYGGSFDPPHVGHVITINTVLNAGLVDEVWLVPTGKHRDKVHQASVDDRKSMLSIMISTVFGSRVPIFTDYTQIDKSWVTSTTAGLLKEMRAKHPDFQFSFIIGTDLIADIQRWENAEKLTKEKGLFLAVERLGVPPPKKMPSYVNLVKTKNLATTNISSSLVRSMVEQGESLEGMVPPAVISFIIRNGLYEKKLPMKELTHVIAEGRFIRFLAENGWEYVQRNNCTGVVIIVAINDQKKVLFTEQYRLPMKKSVIEFPAGLVNDTNPGANESMEVAATRELLEETGYKALKMERLIEGPVSSGLTSETMTFFLAKGLKKVERGGGDETESIKIHEVPLDLVEEWLRKKEKQGCFVDPKIYAGLYFLCK